MAPSCIPLALITRRDTVEKGPANPVPDPKSPTKCGGNAFRKPRTMASPKDCATPMKILAKRAK